MAVVEAAKSDDWSPVAAYHAEGAGKPRDAFDVVNHVAQRGGGGAAAAALPAWRAEDDRRRGAAELRWEHARAADHADALRAKAARLRETIARHGAGGASHADAGLARQAAAQLRECEAQLGAIERRSTSMRSALDEKRAQKRLLKEAF